MLKQIAGTGIGAVAGAGGCYLLYLWMVKKVDACYYAKIPESSTYNADKSHSVQVACEASTPFGFARTGDPTIYLGALGLVGALAGYMVTRKKS